MLLRCLYYVENMITLPIDNRDIFNIPNFYLKCPKVRCNYTTLARLILNKNHFLDNIDYIKRRF